MARLKTDWLDAQYNNRARIPEHAEIFARWEVASVLARDGLGGHLDVPYGDGADEVLDIFPAREPNAPVFLFIHGGYWRALDKSDHSFLAPTFVQSGATVVVPNYSLCPKVGIDAIAVQVARSVAWLYRHAVNYGADPKRIVLCGHSAGAHLAAMLLCCDWKVLGRDLPSRLIQRALAISGVYDLDPIRQTPFLKNDLRLTPGLVRRLSPASYPAPKGMLYAVVGASESEEFLRQNRLIQQTWGNKTVPVCETLPGMHHLNVLHELADPRARLNAMARELLGVISAPGRRGGQR